MHSACAREVFVRMRVRKTKREGCVEIFSKIFFFVPNFVWFVLKVFFFMFLFLWLRATFPRYRYDQIMRLGWKIFIPITIIWIIFLAFAVKFGLKPWF